MRRRSSAGGEPAKAQRRKTVARKSRVTSEAARPDSSSAARKETKVARLTWPAITSDRAVSLAH